MREEVFKPFLRLDDARNQDEGGTGLGLAIARDIARSHGGDITLGDSPLGGLRATRAGAGLVIRIQRAMPLVAGHALVAADDARGASRGSSWPSTSGRSTSITAEVSNFDKVADIGL